jgi:hypothetical protein
MVVNMKLVDQINSLLEEGEGGGMAPTGGVGDLGTAPMGPLRKKKKNMMVVNGNGQGPRITYMKPPKQQQGESSSIDTHQSRQADRLNTKRLLQKHGWKPDKGSPAWVHPEHPGHEMYTNLYDGELSHRSENQTKKVTNPESYLHRFHRKLKGE